jgi:hypothetical protein
MTNLDILIEKLKTFPKNELCKFYCPADQQYYYVMNGNVALRNNSIILRVTLVRNVNLPGSSYRQVIRDLAVFQAFAKTNQLRIQYISGDKEFKLL